MCHSVTVTPDLSVALTAKHPAVCERLATSRSLVLVGCLQVAGSSGGGGSVVRSVLHSDTVNPHSLCLFQ